LVATLETGVTQAPRGCRLRPRRVAVELAAVATTACLVIGFGWGEWMLGGSAKELADNAASSAVVAAIAQICADQFKRSADAADT
jgi:hypothetical protein